MAAKWIATTRLGEVLNSLAEKINSNRLVVPGCIVKVFDLVTGSHRLAEGPPGCLSPTTRHRRTLTLQRIDVRWDLYGYILLTQDF
jgi:hypothetical protein